MAMLKGIVYNYRFNLPSMVMLDLFFAISEGIGVYMSNIKRGFVYQIY